MVLSVNRCCGPSSYSCSCGPPRGRGTLLVVRLRWPGAPCEAEAVISCRQIFFRPAGPGWLAPMTIIAALATWMY